jgi:tetratricopeptide (TPR) repeat protein
MTRRTFLTDPNYKRSIQGLHRLHALALTGRNEDPEADAVRASLERPWQCLSETERKRIVGLSADLDSIGGPPREVEAMNPQAQQRLVEAIEARQAGELDRALELLRRWGKPVDPALLAYLRGSIWQEAGDYATAALFFEEAARLAPDNENYAAMHLFSLARSNLPAALPRMQEILANDEGHAPVVVVRAAEIRFLSTQNTSDVDVRPILQELIRVLERTLRRLQSREARQSSAYDSTYTMATVLLGFCYHHLGDSHTAVRYYNEGVAVAPNHDAVLVARGILCYGVSPMAIQDFEQAARLNSPMIWPYFFLAHHYLLRDRFDECRKMCERALGMSASGTIDSNLWEWLAISRAELGFPPVQVRAAFEEAVRLDPGNERIRRNFRAFEEDLTQQPVHPPVWERPVESLIQAFGRAEYQPALAA